MGQPRNQRGNKKKYMEANENENGLKSLVCSKSHSKRNDYSNTGLPQEARKSSNKQPKLTPKGTRNKTKRKPKVARGRK